MPLFRMYRDALTCLFLTAALFVPLSFSSAAEKAKGTLTYKGPTKSFTVAFKHAYLVKGPDTFEESKTVRRLVLTSADFSAAIKKTDALNGFDGSLMEGVIVELADAPRLNYWLVLNNQLVQYSGMADPAALHATADKPDHLAGKLTIDDTSAGGPKIDVDFDAPLLKAFTKAR